MGVKKRTDFESEKDWLLHKKNIVDARLAEIELKEKAEKRKLDTRKKIIIGGTVLSLLKTDDGCKRTLSELLDYCKKVANEKDKKLF